MNELPSMDTTKLEESFSDVFSLSLNPFSATIEFGIRATKEGESNIMTNRMRMPLQQAKALAVMLLRDIRSYEGRMDVEITLPDQVLTALNIPHEDWKRFSAS